MSGKFNKEVGGFIVVTCHSSGNIQLHAVHLQKFSDYRKQSPANKMNGTLRQQSGSTIC